MRYNETMQKALDAFADRGAQYGDIEDTFQAAASLASIMLRKNITPRDVTMITHALKLARISKDPGHADSYIDGVNYLAFSLQFTSATDGERRYAAEAKAARETPAVDLDALERELRQPVGEANVECAA